MSYDFDTVINRHGTGSLKWDRFDPEVLPLWVADMDFVSAPEILEDLHRRVDHGVYGYTVPYDAVNQVVVDYQKRVHGVDIDPEWLVWLPGMVQGLYLTAMAYAHKGESLMTCTPIYPPFRGCAGYGDREVIEVPLVWENSRWTFDFEAMERAVRKDTRVFMLCNPHNPVGRVFDEEELRAVVAFCARHDLILCSDEIHCDLILDDVSHISTLSLGGNVAEHTMTMMSVSKTYNLPGLACAYAIIPNTKHRNAFKHAARGIITEINTFGYIGTIAAYTKGEAWRKELVAYLKANRDYLYSYVEEHLAPLTLKPMEATYLGWIDTSELDVKNAPAFFREAGVGLSPGSDFGDSDYVRINIGCPRATLEEGLSRMKKALANR